jgi:predicted N-acetyltransferase YhbS
MAAAMNLIFRRATVEDAKALETLINATFCDDQTTQIFLSTEHHTVNVVSAAALADTIAQPDSTVLVATDGDGGPIVGHCYLRLMEDGATAWFGLLAVDIKHKNRGLGGKVFAYAEDYARRELGATRMEFDFVNTRLELKAWYMRRGYVPTGRTLPFPYDAHGEWRGVLRDDLEFIVLAKDLGDVSP